MKFITSFYYSLGTKIVSLLILLISRILTARILGPADLGSVGNALNFASIISRWGSLGIAPAIQFTNSKFPQQKNTLFIYAILSSVLIGIINLIFLLYFQNEILDWQFKSDTNAQLVYLRFFPFLPLIMLSMTLPILLLGSGKIKEYSFTQILPLFLQTVIIAALYFSPKSLDLIIWAQVIYWISTIVTALIFISFKNFRYRFDKDLLIIFVRYSLNAWPQVILQFGIARFAVLIGSQYLSNKDLGYYILASNLSESFLVINTSLTPLIFNKIASQGSNTRLLSISLRFTVILLFPILFITLLFGKPVFIYFFGIEFGKTWDLLLLLLISVLFHSLGRICSNYLAASGKNMIVSGIQLLQLALLAIVCSFACPSFGVSGLSYASICASATGFILCLLMILKVRERKFRNLFSLHNWQGRFEHDFSDNRNPE
ncbi:oligosaccharide flippase family protein [Dyadobacter sp. NIV53]|uniref:oligosaccharide flippase family protein n=1 Tax=Dyadobacter sp. NIV53 TaxID=2861765 RepID=UPI001C8834AE|nr:oligosaccharide flippase family protein [Dyadobacter sp. NIV53]